MRTFSFFNDQDVAVNVTSDAIQIDKRAIWDIIIDFSGTGEPRIVVERSYNGGGCIPEDTDYKPILNPCDNNPHFDIDDTEYILEARSWSGTWLRVRNVDNSATGTIDVKLAYKDFP